MIQPFCNVLKLYSSTGKANAMNSTSPAHPAISATAVVGGGGGNSTAASASEDLHFPSDPISIQDQKDEALLVLKSDLMAALNKEVKSLDEDNWMFDGPRSRIHLISRPGGVLHKQMESTNHRNFALPK